MDDKEALFPVCYLQGTLQQPISGRRSQRSSGCASASHRPRPPLSGTGPELKKDADLASGKRAIEQEMIDMLSVIQSLTIVGMIGATFFVYQTFGPRQLSFSFTKREKKNGMSS